MVPSDGPSLSASGGGCQHVAATCKEYIRLFKLRCSILAIGPWRGKRPRYSSPPSSEDEFMKGIYKILPEDAGLSNTYWHILISIVRLH